jgi:DNA-binding PadR family transcriptional regulator
MAQRRKVGNLLALAVLALVAERPMHPYEMASTLRERGKDASIKINWGSLYTVVQNLEKHGLIQATETTRQGRRPERTVYSITDTGREELEDWLRELISVPDKEYTRFEAALSVLGVLHPDEAVRLLEQRLRTLHFTIAAERAALNAASEEIPRIFLIEGEYSVAMRQAEADWIGSLLKDLADGSITGIELWRQFHETGQLPEQFREMAERGRPLT